MWTCLDADVHAHAPRSLLLGHAELSSPHADASVKPWVPQ